MYTVQVLEESQAVSTSALSAGAKAAILVEALPYIRRFWGKVVVVKYGGNAIGSARDPRASGLAEFATDIVLMRSVGMLPVVVHGGGPQIGDLMNRLGKTPEFRDGLRVTDAETLEIVRMVLVGKVNRDIVTAINVHGPLAVGVSGEDAGMIQAFPRDAALGFVGDISRVEPELLSRLLAQDLVPVVATVGVDEEGQAYNINADTAAGAIAKALSAEKLVFLTNVEGIMADPDQPASLMRQLSAPDLDLLLGRGSIRGGMVPKVAAALDAVVAGVQQVHILDGRVPHALLVEFFTKSGVGTMVVS
jgi:acetylglutamate kinase